MRRCRRERVISNKQYKRSKCSDILFLELFLTEDVRVCRITKKQIEEFDNNFFSVIDESARELSTAFDKLCFEKKDQDILVLSKEAESLLAANHNIPTGMQIYYDIANAYHDLRIIEGVDRECYLEKEIYYLKCVLDIYECNLGGG